MIQFSTPAHAPRAQHCHRSQHCHRFRYSALMLGVCTSFMALNSHAMINTDGDNNRRSDPNANSIALNDANNGAGGNTITATNNTTTNKAAQSAPDTPDTSSTLDLSPTQLEQALIALRLKRAIEKGNIDPSVLREYQKQTLNRINNTDVTTVNNDVTNDVTSNADTTGSNPQANNKTNNSAPDVTDLASGLDDDNGKQNLPDDTIYDFEHALQQAQLSPINITNNSTNVDSPEEIERLLADFEWANRGVFSAPVARLDDNSPPLGLNTTLDDNANDISTNSAADNALYEQVYQNIEQDLRQDNATNKTAVSARGSDVVASKTASMGNVPAGEDITNSRHPEFIADDSIASVATAPKKATNTSDTATPTDDFAALRAEQNSNQADRRNRNQNTNINKGNRNTDDHNNTITGERIAQAQAQGEPIRQASDGVKNQDLGSEGLEGLDNPTPNVTANSTIDPEDYLPEYKTPATDDAEALQNSLETATDAKQEVKQSGEGLFKRIYNRLFNDGVSGLPRINATVYLQDDSRQTEDGYPVLIEADDELQPMNNIKAAIENITVEAIKDFPAAAPRLNEAALSASRAVGYYDIDLHFEQVASNSVNIIIERLGEPVLVNNRVIDARGEGEALDAFVAIEKNGLPLEGDILNHGAYENTKFAIESISERYGFFDGDWLNTSVDVILPDNTADIDLIYSTGERYDFGNVVFFTLDEDTRELTRDEDKLPVNIDLLHQLYEFDAGEPYYQPLVTEFTNDLSATQYFNMFNVDVILPAQGQATLNVVNEPIANNDDTDANNADANNINANNIDTTHGDADTSTQVVARAQDGDGDGEDSVNSANSDGNTAPQIEPIHFDVDEQTADKLQAITAKARRLSNLPNDRVLDTQEHEAKNLLGKLSNAISNIVRKILPDDTDAIADIDENYEAPTLAGKITPQQVQEDKHIPIYVFVMADKPRDAQLGIGYGTDTGVRTVAQLQHNLLNKNGYQAGIRVGASDIRKTVNVELNRPWRHPLDDTLHANLAYEQEIINQGEGNLDLRTDTIKAGLARNIRPPSGWDRTYSLRYRLDELESGVTGTDRADLPEPFNRRNAKFTQQSLLLGYAMHKVQSDNLTDPTHGFSQYYSIEAGSDSLLTDTNMAILRARLGTVQSFGDFDKHQIVANLDTGYIWADEFNDVPYKQRFFAGGDRSLRGYDYNSLSALDNGYLIGGQVLALGSAEYNYEFKPKLRAAVFADVGNAYDTDFTTDTKLGLGAGIRWSSPIGLVRLDVAAGVLEESIPIRLHFFIGSPLQ